MDGWQPYTQVLEEYDATKTKGSYVYGYDLICRVSGMQPEFYHSDGLGSTPTPSVLMSVKSLA